MAAVPAISVGDFLLNVSGINVTGYKVREAEREGAF